MNKVVSLSFKTPRLISFRSAFARSFRTTRCLSLKTGIVGLPNVGKSSLFNALCQGSKAEVANYPFCTIEPNVGIASVEDPRLQVLSKMSKSLKTVPAIIEYVDVAGLVKGASKGEGLGNKFLANIRECDSIVQVVRCFENKDIHHVSGKVDPCGDVDIINLEMIMSDLGQVEKRLAKLRKSHGKGPDKEKELLERILVNLDLGKSVRTLSLSEEEDEMIKHLQLLSNKKMLYVANVGDDDLAFKNSAYINELQAKADDDQSNIVILSAQIEAELSLMPHEEANEYLSILGVKSSGLSQLIIKTYNQLDLQTYFTTGKEESRSWAFKKGMAAPEAAGVIHSDFVKKFIRAEVVAYEDFVSHGGYAACKEKGILRSEGKGYVVSDGDVVHFKINN